MQPRDHIEHGRDDPDVQSVIAEICRRLEWRIRPVISHLSEAEIEQLLQRMTWLKYKFDGHGALETLPRNPNLVARASEPLEADQPMHASDEYDERCRSDDAVRNA
jgi:hypothetical protein